jgi:glycosyltransferase involved in cell wall biosynthesis
MRLAEKITRPLDTVSVGVSASVATEFASTFYFRRGREMHVIDNGININALQARLASANGGSIREELGLTDELMFLNVGRLAPKKRQRDLIDAMALLDEPGQSSHLVVVGGGELEDELRTRVRNQEIEDRVTVTGRVPTVEPYYSAADVYIHAAVYEGWPITLAEALTAEVPIIASNAPGTADVIGDAGILVSPQSPTEFAEAMTALDAKRKRERLATRSLSRAEECHIENTVEQYVSLYRSVSA